MKAWSDAQNARTRAYLDGIPGRAAVQTKLTRLIKAASPFYGKVEARRSRVFALYNNPAKQQPWIVTMDASPDPSSRTALLDPNAMDPAGHTAIDWFVPSPDGTKIAVSLSRNGSEDGTLYVYDVATAKEIDAPM